MMYRFGPRLDREGVTFRLWAPAARTVDLVCGETLTMRKGADGWFELAVPRARPGLRYGFRIDGELDVPDPASAFQPDDVSGQSQVVDHGYDWQATDWRGRPWHETVILETHVGTFTPAGTFRAMIEKLDHLVATGVTALELMPLADFPGRRNWGYDGVLLYAPGSAYGTPDDLKALVDAAHGRGLMVFLDVVYNHFGPEGNYLGRYAPSFFSTKAHTPWGAAVDYGIAEVRAFAIENALHWLDRYRFDGLRLDAVHAIGLPGEPHILTALSRAVGDLAERSGRLIHLVLENDDNTAWLLDPPANPPQGKYRAQWNDDYHHAWHTFLTREARGYYKDYQGDEARHLPRMLASGFAYQGETSRHRDGRARGEASEHLPPTAFVSFLQNHDQIGNRARGERLDVLAAPERIEAALAVTLLAPFPPLMFQGEEWGSTQAFPFFCDFAGDLAEAVRRGRKAEFAEDYAHQADNGAIPDPLADKTFGDAVLDWSAQERAPHKGRLDLVRRLLAVRRAEVVPRLAGVAGGGARSAMTDGILTASWPLSGGTLHLMANLSDAPKPGKSLPGRPIWGPPLRDQVQPWSVHWSWQG
ncbi:malto-oligosyltrehalose trehalohydrolase [Xanthobacteraceae bacterium Astr-EGSB]|nr:malto-oligosyltrehalose trehalohydrolase [Xanthobacteraceae bacterium Astr-EGSB]